MTTTTTTSGFTTEAFEQFIAERGEPAWLVDLRRDAWNKFQELPTPSRKQEEWMRTDIRLFRLEKFGMPTEGAADPATITLPTGLLAQGVELGGAVASINGQPAAARLDPKWASRGVLFGNLDELVHKHGDKIRPHLTRAVQPGQDKFAALHAACWSGGTLLYVPRGVTVHQPLHTLAALHPGKTDLGHTLVVLEDDAEATLLAETTGGGESALHCGAIELIVGRGARLQY
ncbi:MAG: Fe-S cluster assembly protein SufD, partial [Pirellulales bacterium]